MHILDADEATAMVNASVAALPPQFDGCVMCALASGEENVVCRTSKATVVLDRFASTRGHLLVVLNQHHEHLMRLEWSLYEAVQRLAWEASRAIDRVLAPCRVYVASLGSPSQIAKSYPHLHLHVVPIFEDGESARPARIFSWTQGVLIYEPHEARALAAELAANWP